jgi:hypothetical protein
MKINPSYTVSKNLSLFENWWQNVGYMMVDKISSKYRKENPEYDPNMELKNDRDFVHSIYHNHNCYDLTCNLAEMAFYYGKNNIPWTLNKSNSLFCDLDKVVLLAHKSGDKYD